MAQRRGGEEYLSTAGTPLDHGTGRFRQGGGGGLVSGAADALIAGMRHIPSTAFLGAGLILAACGGGNDENRRPASISVVSGNNQAAEVGQTLTQAVMVEVRDAANDPIENQTVSWTVLLGSGTVSVPSSLTDAQGRTSTAWTLGYSLGPGHTLRAQAGPVQTAAFASATLGAGGTLSTASGDNQTGTVNQELGTALGVRARTAGGQDVANVPIDWAVASGGGSVGSASTLTGANGIATVAWTLGPGTGTQDVTATNSSLTPTSVILSANAIVPPPSMITGTVTLADTLLSALRASRLSVQRRNALLTKAEMPAARRVPRRLARTQDPYHNELLVRLKAGSVNAPVALRARTALSTARLVGRTIHDRLAVHLVSGRVAITGVSPVILTARLKVTDPGKADSVAKALALNPAVESVGRNGRLRAAVGPVRPGTIPDDPFFPFQSWHYSMIDLPRAWSTVTGLASVIVAVLDNGAVFHHPGVGQPGATYQTGGGNYRNDGYDFVHSSVVSLCAAEGGGTINNAGDGDGYDPDPSTPDDRDPSDPPEDLPCARSDLGSHGTQVAGTIGGKGNDGANVTGVNWTVGIRPVRVLGINGGDYYDIAQGVLYAAGLPADNGSGGVLTPPALPARIINMSLGGTCLVGPDPLLSAIQAVTDPGRPNGGTLVVVSAGNENSSEALCPAAYDEVLAVGAVGPAGTRASYSSFGSFVDLAAPGGDLPVAELGVVSTACDFTVFPAPCTPNYAISIGTSIAAPHVAGVAALLLADNAGLTPDQIRSRLLTYATPIASGQLIGNLVNARNALTQTSGPVRQLFVRAVDVTTGATVATTPAAAGAVFSINGLPDGSYFVVAGEDESGDGEIGIPGRRFGAFGGVSSPLAIPVSSTIGGYASFNAGYPVEEEPNDVAGSAIRLIVEGSVQGSMYSSDVADFYRIQVPVAGTYTFETTGVSGAFCGFALDLDTVLELRNSAQSLMGSSIDIDLSGFNFCSRISLPLTPGTYYLKVTRDIIGGVLHTGRYVLQARVGQ